MVQTLRRASHQGYRAANTCRRDGLSQDHLRVAYREPQRPAAAESRRPQASGSASWVRRLLVPNVPGRSSDTPSSIFPTGPVFRPSSSAQAPSGSAYRLSFLEYLVLGNPPTAHKPVPGTYIEGEWLLWQTTHDAYRLSSVPRKPVHTHRRIVKHGRALSR